MLLIGWTSVLLRLMDFVCLKCTEPGLCIKAGVVLSVLSDQRAGGLGGEICWIWQNENWILIKDCTFKYTVWCREVAFLPITGILTPGIYSTRLRRGNHSRRTATPWRNDRARAGSVASLDARGLREWCSKACWERRCSCRPMSQLRMDTTAIGTTNDSRALTFTTKEAGREVDRWVINLSGLLWSPVHCVYLCSRSLSLQQVGLCSGVGGPSLWLHSLSLHLAFVSHLFDPILMFFTVVVHSLVNCTYYLQSTCGLSFMLPCLEWRMCIRWMCRIEWASPFCPGHQLLCLGHVQCIALLRKTCYKTEGPALPSQAQADKEPLFELGSAQGFFPLKQQ